MQTLLPKLNAALLGSNEVHSSGPNVFLHGKNLSSFWSMIHIRGYALGVQELNSGMPSPTNVLIASMLPTIILATRALFIEYCNRHGYE